jgi:hypothetical protein
MRRRTSIMDNDQNRCVSLLRRIVLARAALALGAALGATAMPAAAQTKLSQAVAKYQDQPRGQQRCETCGYFQPPSACKLVEGNISPKGWCQLWAGMG